ncbi:hypothetical protein BDQ17DRAFT_1327535 [Cyathus striatus]|nr:hypothetical protein BDQ17DRAFT_1327535 [Cyathus striatus]
MNVATNPPPDIHSKNSAGFIIAPQEICKSCNRHSGSAFFLTDLKGPSPLHRIGVIPTGPDLESTLSTISYTESETKRLDNEIARVKLSLDALQQRRDALYQFSLQEQALFAPIRKLPEDILCNIFLEAEIDSEDGIDICNAETFVRIIRQVSYHWRSLVDTFAPLWSHVTVVWDWKASKGKRDMVGSFLEKCISLSKEFPLTMRLSGCPGETLGFSCLQALGQNAFRWKNIRVDNEESELLESIISHVPKNETFTLLTHLEVSNIKQTISFNPTPKLSHLTVRDVEDITIKISFQSSPLLTDLTLEYVNNPTKIFEDTLWFSVTHFEPYANELYLDELSFILKRMPNLLSLCMKGLTRADITQAITLSHLCDFTLFQEDTNVLEHFIMPCLRSLEVHEVSPSASILQLLKRSKCPLETLCLDEGLSGEGWSPNIDELKNVKTLMLNNTPFIGKDLLKLTRSSSSMLADSLFPRLEVFGISAGGATALTYVHLALISMLKSRLPPVEQQETSISEQKSGTEWSLKDVTVTFNKRLANEQVRYIKDFLQSDEVQRSGIRVSISHSAHSYFTYELEYL